MDLKTCKKYIENNRFNNLRPKTASNGIKPHSYINVNKNPGVGSYEPEKIYTVKHDIMNKIKQGNKTFNSTLLSNRNAIYDFQKNAPNGPGTYFQNNIYTPFQQNYNGFNTTSYRFEKGGKNNTKEILDEISENKFGLNAVISTFVNRDDIYNNNNIKKMRDNKNTNNNTIEYKAKKGKSKPYEKKSKKSYLGPGTYDYTADRYPWIKPSFNAKYA